MSFPEDTKKIAKKHKRRAKASGKHDLTKPMVELAKETYNLNDEQANYLAERISNLDSKDAVALAGTTMANEISMAKGINLMEELADAIAQFCLKYLTFSLKFSAYYTSVWGIKEIGDRLKGPQLAEIYAYIRGMLERFISLSDYYFDLAVAAIMTGKPFYNYLNAMLSQYESLYYYLIKMKTEYIPFYGAYLGAVTLAKINLEGLSQDLADLEYYKNKIQELVSQFKIFKILQGRTLSMSIYPGFLDQFFEEKQKLQAEIKEGLQKGPFYIFYSAPDWYVKINIFLTLYMPAIVGLRALITPEVVEKIAGVSNAINNVKRAIDRYINLEFLDPFFLKAYIILVKYPYIFDYRISDYLNLMEDFQRTAFGLAAEGVKDLKAFLLILGTFLAMFQMPEFAKFTQGLKNLYEKFDKEIEKAGYTNVKKNLDEGNVDKAINSLENQENLKEGSEKANEYYNKAKEEPYVSNQRKYIELADYEQAIEKYRFYQKEYQYPLQNKHFSKAEYFCSRELDRYESIKQGL
ncbi:MAG: hypothetical protein QXI58_00595 [Candidatus Micrarchaeia archaeon]